MIGIDNYTHFVDIVFKIKPLLTIGVRDGNF